MASNNRPLSQTLLELLSWWLKTTMAIKMSHLILIRVWTQLIHSLIAKMWIMARKLRLSFSKRVASLRMSFIEVVPGNRTVG